MANECDEQGEGDLSFSSERIPSSNVVSYFSKEENTAANPTANDKQTPRGEIFGDLKVLFPHQKNSSRNSLSVRTRLSTNKNTECEGA